MPKLLTVQEAAEYLRVTDQTVIRYIKSEQLEAKKVGRGWRIPEDQLTKFLDQPDAVKANE